MEKIWLEKSYPPGVAHEIDADYYDSIVDMFHIYTKQFQNNTAFINMDASITYGELAEQAKTFAAYLQQDLGLKKGDKFAIMLPNTLQYPIAVFGALMAGLTVVNVNPLYTSRELEHQLKDSETKAILIIENYAHVLEKVIKKSESNINFWADISKAKKELNWTPKTTINHGLNKTWLDFSK